MNQLFSLTVLVLCLFAPSQPAEQDDLTVVRTRNPAFVRRHLHFQFTSPKD